MMVILLNDLRKTWFLKVHLDFLVIKFQGNNACRMLAQFLKGYIKYIYLTWALLRMMEGGFVHFLRLGVFKKFHVVPSQVFVRDTGQIGEQTEREWNRLMKVQRVHVNLFNVVAFIYMIQ